MGKRLKLNLLRVIPSFQSCRSTLATSNPVPSFLGLSDHHPVNRNTIKRHVSSALTSMGCGSSSRSPPPNDGDGFRWEKEDKYWHVIAKVLPDDAPLAPPNTDEEMVTEKKRSRRRRRRRRSTAPARLSRWMEVEGKVRESFAVVKSSEEPYEDFKRSMMEMVVEKRMFKEEDLEELLRCFLSLNSRDHHEAIVRAFSEDVPMWRRRSNINALCPATELHWEAAQISNPFELLQILDEPGVDSATSVASATL